MKKKIFGTDGIRGKFNSQFVNEESFFVLAKAISQQIVNIQNKKIVIACDSRQSSDCLLTAFINGLDNDIKIINLGVAPTPCVSFVTKKYNANYGVMITASHNHYLDNGIKFFVQSGEKMNQSEQSDLEKIYFTLNTDNLSLQNIKDKIQINHEYKNEYFYFFDSILSNNNKKLAPQRMKIVFDCANGSMLAEQVNIIKSILEKYNIDSTFYNITPNGTNINENCGATKLEFLQNLKDNFDLGVSFDGDADRVLFVNNEKKQINGDDILAFTIKYSNNEFNKICSTSMSNMGFIDYLEQQNIQHYMVDVGDHNVIATMSQQDILLGGENSGHMIVKPYCNTGDGLIFTAFVLSLMIKNQLKTIENDIYKKYPSSLKSIKYNENKNKKSFILPLLQQIQEEVIKQNPKTKCIIRLSGTEPLIRILVENENIANVNKIESEIITQITNNMSN